MLFNIIMCIYMSLTNLCKMSLFYLLFYFFILYLFRVSSLRAWLSFAGTP